MGKNIKGGKNRKRGKNVAEETQTTVFLNFKKEGQEYAKVTKMLGNCRLLANCYNDNGGYTERLCIIPGKFKKRVYMNMNDIILVSIRDFQDNKVDIIYKYTPQEAIRLIKKGLIPDESDWNNITKNAYGMGIEFVGTGADGEGIDVVVKKKVVRGKDEDYLDKSILPPSDSDSDGDTSIPKYRRPPPDSDSDSTESADDKIHEPKKTTTFDVNDL